MKNKSFAFSILTAICALTLSAAAFGTSASATDTPTPSPTPVVSTDSGASDDAEISSLLTSQVEVTNSPQEADSSVDAVIAEDSQEQASFSDDINAATQAGDSDAVAQLTADAAIVTSIDAPEVKAVATDDTEAHSLILGLPQK